MTVRHRLAGLALALAGAVALTTLLATVARAEGSGGRLSFGDDVIIEPGETVSGNVVLVGADLSVRRGGVVDGDVAVTFGDATIDGQVTGQVFAAGDLSVGPTGEIDGDVVVLGRDAIDPAASVGGRITRGGDRLGVTPGMEEPEEAVPSALSRLGRILVSTALAMLIAALVVTVAPMAVSRVGTAMAGRSAASFGVGCVAWILLLPLAIALTITVVGVVALGLFYFLAVLVGAVALAEFMGNAVAPGAARAGRGAMGAAVLALAFNVGTTEDLALLCASLAAALLVSAWPLGAGILTLIGTRPWPPEAAPPPWPQPERGPGGGGVAPEPSTSPGDGPAAGDPKGRPAAVETESEDVTSTVEVAPEAPPLAVEAAPGEAPPAVEVAPAEAPPAVESAGEPGTPPRAEEAGPEDVVVTPEPLPPEASEAGGVLGKVADASGTPPPESSLAAPVPPGETAPSSASRETEIGAPEPDLTAVPGITAVYAELLRVAGIDGLADLAVADPEAVAAAVSVPGVLPVTRETAASWIRAATDLTGSTG